MGNEIIRIPKKYKELLQTISQESVGKILLKIFGSEIDLSQSEIVFYNLMMCDIEAIEKSVSKGKKGGNKGGRPKQNKTETKDKQIESKTEDIDNKNEKKVYGTSGIVFLRETEYEQLREWYNTSVVMQYVLKLENYIINNLKGKDKYTDHYLVLQNWITTDGIKKSPYQFL